MSGRTFFDRLDQVPLQIATERFGFAMVSAAMPIVGAIIDDPRISPTVMLAGLCRAHAAGLAGAIGSVRQLVDGDPDEVSALQEELIEASVAFIRSELARP